MSSETLLWIVVAIAVLIMAPPFMISAYGWFERRHHRRMNQRRTDKFKL